MNRNDRRRAAGNWLGRNYPMPPGDFRYDVDAALDEAGLREEGYGPDDVLAWVMPSREAAGHYERATRELYGRRQLSYVNGDGQVIAVTIVRGDPEYPEEDHGA